MRVALLSQKLDGRDRIWATGGAAPRSPRCAASCSAASSWSLRSSARCRSGPSPRSAARSAPAPSAACCSGAAIRTDAFGRFLEAFTTLLRQPRVLARVTAWSVLSQGAKLAAAASVAAALAVPHPFVAALVIVPTLQLATTFPLTPGNVGVASGAVALALQSRGVPVTQAIATGIAFHAVETIVGIAFGTAGTLAVVPVPPLVRRVAVGGRVRRARGRLRRHRLQSRLDPICRSALSTATE